MFQLIENVYMACKSADVFISKHDLGEAPNLQTVENLLPGRLPCLIDWFVGLTWQRQSILGCHICTKSTAKCLVYPKTNKLYPVSQCILREAGEIKKALQRSPYTPKSYTEIKTDPEFNKVVAKCEKDNEPFLIRFRMIRGRFSDIGHIHMTVLNLATAKQLVYYKKNNRPPISVSTHLNQNEDVRREIDRVIVQAIEQSHAEVIDNEDNLPF